MSLPEIITTRSKYVSWLQCQRKRYWEYEAPNSGGTRGWERKALALPLATGRHMHKIIEGLLSGQGEQADEVIRAEVLSYLAEAEARGIDSEVTDDQLFVMQEQAALLEALGWAYARVRLPRILEAYEVVDVEREEFTLLSGDVGLQSRCDAILRRRSDGYLFIYNPKTVSSVDHRWRAQWEVDTQIMTETLAVERRLGEKVWGVLIDGIIKGSRVDVTADFKECRGEAAVAHRINRTRLLWGYRCDANPPLQPKPLFDWEGTTRKGWRKFPVWQANDLPGEGSPVRRWLSFLPVEVLEQSFLTMEPVMRDDEAMESAVRQIVSAERQIAGAIDFHMLDEHFPQNTHACNYPLRCPMYDLCWLKGAAADPEAVGYQPRVSNHPEVQE